MTHRPTYPEVDGRRVSELRRDLLRDIAALAPDWRAPAEPLGADRAIVEIAARLSEEATRRLDRTPERDALAFLEMFDVAAPRPSAARGVSVFALKEGKTAPVFAPSRTGIEIETVAGDNVKFETADDLRIQPARIGLLATVDPATDRLELAPPVVTSLEPDLTPRPAYRLAASAGPEATVISLTPPVGILPGDLLRVSVRNGTSKYLKVAAFSDDGLAELAAPVGGAGLLAAQVGGIERMTRLDAFRMPDAQEHGLYIGDLDILNVKEPAEITLRFEPAGTSALLSPNDVDFEIWGTREGPGAPEDAPRWHRLVPLAGGGPTLRLLKAWVGPVDELELGDKKARFLRIRPRAPIVPENGGHRLTGSAAALDTVKLGIKTKKPEDDTGDTVSQVAYNGTPLPLTSAFLPFGAEPRRFDAFALAAPEAFTKRGATVTLDFSLTDATMAVMAAAGRLDDERHAYGVGRNGRLQAMILTGERTLWRELGVPPEEVGEGQILSLDPNVAPAAFGESKAGNAATEASDIVVAATTGSALVSAQVKLLLNPQASADEAIEAAKWHKLPALPDGALGDDGQLSIAAAPVQNGSSNFYTGLVLAATPGGVNALALSNGGGAPSGVAWQRVPADEGDPAPILPAEPNLHLVDNSVQNGTALFVATDAAQAVWLLNINLDGTGAHWTPLVESVGNPITLATGARPAVILVAGAPDVVLVAAPGDGSLDMWRLDASNGFALLPFPAPMPTPLTQPEDDMAAAAYLRFAPGLQAFADLPHVLSYQNAPGTGKVIEWAPGTGQISRHQPAPDMVLDDPRGRSSAAIFPPGSDDPQARVVFSVQDQRVGSVKINPSALADTLEDWVAALVVQGFSEALVVHDHDLGTPGSGVISTAVKRGKLPSGDEIYRFGPGNVDWTADVVVYRASKREDVEYVGALPVTGILTGSSQSARASLVSTQIIVRPGPASPEYALFTVLATNDDDELTIDNPVMLDNLLNNPNVGETVSAAWHQVKALDPIPGSSTPANEMTLVGLTIQPDPPLAVGNFETPGVADLTPLADTGSATRMIVPPWQGPPPANKPFLFKLVPQNAAPEMLVAQSQSSEFSDPELSWEYFNGEGWKRLDKDFRDATSELQRSGTVSFTVPRDLIQTEIGGQEDYWIRTRLVAGDYGKPEYKVETSGTTQTVKVDTSKLRPPEVARVTAEFDLKVGQYPQFVVARNNLRDLDQSSANRLAGAAFAMFEGAFAHPIGDGGRALFLGMTQPLEPGSASLFVEARDKSGTATLIAETLGADNAWAPAPLSVEDPTLGLYRSGLLRFTVSERPAQVFLFGQALHWLRLRAEGAIDWAPEITGLWLNGVRIVQAETIRQELLGSSAGEPDLELSLLKPQVLANSLELRVRERLGSEEANVLRQNARPDEPEPIRENVPNLPGQWVLWRQVDSLFDQSADARVYLMNPDGRLRFGNDRNGRIIPAGQDNIRAFQYQKGGQRVETKRFAGAKLAGSVDGVEMVLAPAPIAGGSNLPKRQDLVARMPAVLRHAGDGLSLADLEALAHDADSEIVQARAFAPVAAGGPVRLIVLARGERRTPVYSLAQQENLRCVLTEQMSDAWAPGCLDVQSAGFVEVRVAVTLLAKPGGLATLETAAGIHLRTFLHAAKGGPGLAGWPPGRALWPTDIRRALSGIETLDRVVDVRINMPDGRALGDVRPHEVVTTALARDVSVLVKGEAAT